jgi:hypothetical protein
MGLMSASGAQGTFVREPCPIYTNDPGMPAIRIASQRVGTDILERIPFRNGSGAVMSSPPWEMLEAEEQERESGAQATERQQRTRIRLPALFPVWIDAQQSVGPSFDAADHGELRAAGADRGIKRRAKAAKKL